jgi:hypothetical protein
MNSRRTNTRHHHQSCAHARVWRLTPHPSAWSAQRTEARPRYDGARGACHKYHTELSGTAAPADNLDTSHPGLTLSLHPIGGELRTRKGGEGKCRILCFVVGCP